MTTSVTNPRGPTPGAPVIMGEDLLSVKVMRMKKPSFKSVVPITVEETDELGGIDEAEKVFYQGKSYESLGFSEYLMLPDEFGKIYVGEELRLYINLHNQSKQNLNNIILKIDLVKGKERKMLMDMTRDPIHTLLPGKCHETLISQPLYEIGMHIIVVNVHYRFGEGSAQKKMVRKIFKFNSELPLKMVDLKIHELGRSENFVQMDLRNLTSSMLYVLVRFVPYKHVYKVIDHSHHSEKKGGLQNYPLNVDETRRYLFEVHQKPGFIKRNLGKIEFQWKTNFGERGLLTTSGIDKVLRPPPQIEVTIKDFPEEVKVEDVFEVKLQVKNNMNKDVLVDLLCDVNHMFPIVVNGKSLQYIGTIKSGKTVEHKVQLLSLKAGLQVIGGDKCGIKVRDISNNTLYPISLVNIQFYAEKTKPVKKKNLVVQKILQVE